MTARVSPPSGDAAAPSPPIATPTGGWLVTHLRDRFQPVLVIVSPPRCGSTVLARSLWRHPRLHWYVHEPFDRLYYRGGDQESVRAAVSDAIPRPEGDRPDPHSGSERGVIVKEMTFQAGPLLPELLESATLPVVVAVRDPRLAISSRMWQRKKAGLDPCFPHLETGWADLEDNLGYMHEHAVPHIVVDMTELRRRPAALVPALCERLGLAFVPELLSWPSAGDLSLGQLHDEQHHWYSRVLASTGFEPPTEPLPGLESFPTAGGMRVHVGECLAAYRSISENCHTLLPAAQDPSEEP